MQRSITLFVANLAAALRSLEQSAPVRAPELEVLFGRAEWSPLGARSEEGVAFEIFGIPVAADTHVPIAPVIYGLDVGTMPDRYVLRADPVFVAPDRDVLRLMAHAELAIAPDEAQSIVQTLNDHFAADGLRFEAPQSHRWYVTTPDIPRLELHAPASALGQSVDPVLPKGADAQRWHGVINEIQMLLHAHPVNAAREARGELPVNSLWLWGGGRTPAAVAARWAQLWSDDALLLGLAKHTRVPRTGALAGATAWLDAAITPGDHLLTPPHSGADARQRIEALNRDWIAPLMLALKARRIASLTLVMESGARCSAHGKILERWWVRRRPLVAWNRNSQPSQGNQ
jgi:hypothetical protein